MSIDGTPIILWCFVQGSSSIFKVNIGTNNDIDDLKEAIKSKKPNDTAGVDADKLRLWGVNVASISDISEDMLNDDNELKDERSTIINFENKQLLVDKSYYQWTLNCIKTMADIYSNEKLRQREFHEKIRELFREEVKLLQLDDQSSNDGVLECNVHAKSILYLLIEVKNEIGTGKCDPTTQAAISFAKFYTQSKNEQMLKWCNMPCFIIGLAGPWICVLGAVYVEKPLVEPLTNLIPLILINDRDHLKKIARLFMALRLGCDELKKYYRPLPSPTTNEQRFFPYTRKIEDFEFEYKEKLVDDSYKLLWKAETKDKQMIIVKFTHRYNKEAHDLCYGIGKAPRLFYVLDKQCGLHMIVMEFVEGQILRDCVHLAQSDYEVIINDIEEAVLHLHGKNLVFADLRDSNILVTRDSEGYHGILIDFDWVGRENVECYPLFINLDIAWPTGVGDNEPLKRNMICIG
ncbi:7096_t:CDS:2 [Funneliformis caledonium]|uniref:7096_t:CDS:1 n=1 Tax=Funneliformis caledonium TaxID=1117310 RepID=A0A9N8YNL2_9GLOM|nr:7096_t:CDS:2 [Funneliformis caledonium]